MCRNCDCETEEILMLSGIDSQLGQASSCAEDEYYDAAAGRCVPYGYAPPATTCDPPAVMTADGVCVECAPGLVWVEGIGCQPTDPSAPMTPPGFVAPGAVPVVVKAWDLDAQPHAQYVLQWGDTYVGLSATYLGDGARWREIWNLNRQQHPNPDQIYVTQTINMPDEARDKLKRWLKGNQKGNPGNLSDEPTLKEHARNAAPWIIAAAVVAAGGYYLMS